MMRILEFGDRQIEPDVRKLSDMKDVIYDWEWLKDSDDIDLYYMYRDLALNESDRKLIVSRNLRYDITVIPPLMLGCEYVKTLGHYHPNVPGTDLSYTEIYEILDGEAHYLLQKSEGGRIIDVVVIEAKKGDKVIIPPGYGHITINPSSSELKMANFVSNEFSSVYGPIKEKGGGAYFKLIDGWVKNKNYEYVPDIRRLKAKVPAQFESGMYSLIRKSLDVLDFLNNPQNNERLFRDVLGQ